MLHMHVYTSKRTESVIQETRMPLNSQLGPFLQVLAVYPNVPENPYFICISDETHSVSLSVTPKHTEARIRDTALPLVRFTAVEVGPT